MAFFVQYRKSTTMNIYIVNCDKLKFFQTFKSMDEVIEFLDKKNKAEFDGNQFTTFGRRQDKIITKEGNIYWEDRDYYIDSVVLCPKDFSLRYFQFNIRCIDQNGNSVELD
ncbi:MAG: hypothetical protein ACI8Q1_000251 [Parvicella sp.]|jgi:hypothetical protein